MPSLTVTGPVAVLNVLAALLDRTPSADFEWVQTSVTGRKSPSPNRWVWEGEGGPKRKVRYSKSKPGSGRKPTVRQANPARETPEELLEELISRGPADMADGDLHALAESLATEYTRDELRALGKKMGWKAGAKIKDQLALDIVEQARKYVESTPLLRAGKSANLADLTPPTPTTSPVALTKSDYSEDLMSWRKTAVLHGQPLTAEDEEYMVDRASVLAREHGKAIPDAEEFGMAYRERRRKEEEEAKPVEGQALEDEAMDAAVDRARQLGRPFREDEVFQEAWDQGMELMPTLDDRFQRAGEDAEGRPLWVVAGGSVTDGLGVETEAKASSGVGKSEVPADYRLDKDAADRARRPSKEYRQKAIAAVSDVEQQVRDLYDILASKARGVRGSGKHPGDIGTHHRGNIEGYRRSGSPHPTPTVGDVDQHVNDAIRELNNRAKELVRIATNDGKYPLPPEVLADYPDLAPATPPTPAPEQPGFTGTITDSLGRKVTYVDGERVAGEGEETKAPVMPEESPEVPTGPTPADVQPGRPLIPLSEIPYDVAYNAYYWNSFTPEKRALQRQQDYSEGLLADWDALAKFASTPEDQALLASEFDRYRKGYREKYLAWLQAMSRTASSMVTGPSNFPTERNRKRLETERRRMEELIEFRNKALKAIQKKVAPATDGPILSADPEAVSKLREKLAQMEALQDRMKAVNKAHERFLKDPKSLDSAPISEADKERVRQYKPEYSWEPHPFPPYATSNNNANMRRVRDRIAELEKMHAGGDKEETWGDVTVQEDPSAARIRLLFPGKPDRQTIDALKFAGFRWAPSEGAWQRHLNNAGRYAAESVLKKLGKEKTGSSSPASAEVEDWQPPPARLTVEDETPSESSSELPTPGFTGTITDSLGRKITYVDGVRVAAPEEANAGAGNSVAPLDNASQPVTLPPEVENTGAGAKGKAMDRTPKTATVEQYIEEAVARKQAEIDHKKNTLRERLATARTNLERARANPMASVGRHEEDVAKLERELAAIEKYKVDRESIADLARGYYEDDVAAGWVAPPAPVAPPVAPPAGPAHKVAKGTLKRNGQAIQVSAGEMDRIKKSGAKVLEFEGRTYKLTGWGNTFKANGFLNVYAYVEEAGAASPPPVPPAGHGRTPLPGGQPRTFTMHEATRSVGEVFRGKDGGMWLVTESSPPKHVSSGFIDDTDAWDQYPAGAGRYGTYTAIPVEETDAERQARELAASRDAAILAQRASQQQAVADAWKPFATLPTFERLPGGLDAGKLKWQDIGKDNAGAVLSVATLPSGETVGRRVWSAFDDQRTTYHVPENVASQHAHRSGLESRLWHLISAYTYPGPLLQQDGLTPEQAVEEMEQKAAEYQQAYGSLPPGMTPKMLTAAREWLAANKR